MQYDSVGDVTKVEGSRKAPNQYARKSRTTSFSEPTSITDPMGRTTTYAYDGDGNLMAVTDPLGTARSATTGRRADVGRRPRRATPPTSPMKTEQTTSTDPLGHETQVAYDSLGQPAGIRDPEGKLDRTRVQRRQRTHRAKQTPPARKRATNTTLTATS